MNKPAAIAAGGILWGLWHTPFTILGHNFGVDYPLYPWLGIFVMCIYCTFMNGFLTLITERTGSIYPVCFAHGINNNIGSLILPVLFMKEDALEKLSSVKAGIELYPEAMFGLAVIFVFSMSFFCKKK